MEDTSFRVHCWLDSSSRSVETIIHSPRSIFSLVSGCHPTPLPSTPSQSNNIFLRTSKECLKCMSQTSLVAHSAKPPHHMSPMRTNGATCRPRCCLSEAPHSCPKTKKEEKTGFQNLSGRFDRRKRESSRTMGLVNYWNSRRRL